MDSMDFQLRLKPVMDVSDIQGNLGTLQQYLNKLKLPDSMKSGFKETFANAEKEVTKIQDILGKKTKTKGDVLGLEKSFGNLDKYFNKLANDMNKISGKKIFDGMKFSTPEMDQALAKIKTLKEELKQQIPSNSIKEVNNAIKEMSTVSKSVSLERFKKAFASGDIASASKEFKNLQANLKGWTNTANQTKYAEGFEKLKKVFENMDTSKIQSIKQELKQMDINLEQLSTEQMEKLLNYFNTGVNDVRNMAKGIKDYGNQVSRAEARQVDLNNQIGQLKDRVKYFFSLTNAVQLMRRALRDAFNQMKELDAVMTETAVVTSFDVGDMWDKLPEYTENANKLGVSIKGMYEASTLYYQQGLKTKEAMELSNETMKMARIAGMEAADATDRMTAALRGFNMELNETSAQRVNDVYSKLAAITASDTDEISNAMTKTASIAASAGMEFETTSAFLAQMINFAIYTRVA